ncbi:hypothetical protein CO652_22785 [Rhizobium sp. H4]|nr:hypothetical protein CO652_22785 [Rhizobium sp. H4]
MARVLDAQESRVLRCPAGAPKGEAGALTPMDARSSVGACPSRLRPLAYAPQDEGGWWVPRPLSDLILRCPAGASKDEVGHRRLMGCKEHRWSVSFEASAFGLRASVRLEGAA